MAENLLKLMKDEDVQYVDLRFTDPRGKMQHVSFHKDMVEDDFFTEGQMFDGSSVAGWKAIDHQCHKGWRAGGSRLPARHGDRSWK